jgi:hypothetical protein
MGSQKSTLKHLTSSFYYAKHKKHNFFAPLTAVFLLTRKYCSSKPLDLKMLILYMLTLSFNCTEQKNTKKNLLLWLPELFLSAHSKKISIKTATFGVSQHFFTGAREIFTSFLVYSTTK